jgi:hypothetical protein
VGVLDATASSTPHTLTLTLTHTHTHTHTHTQAMETKQQCVQVIKMRYLAHMHRPILP